MTKHIKSLAGALFLLFPLLLSAAPVERTRSILIDSLEQRLEEINTASDSLTTLYNIYDVAKAKAKRIDALRRLYFAAKHNHRDDLQTDALTRIAKIYPENDSILALVEQEVETLPFSPRREEARLYVQILRIDYEFDNTNEDILDRKLSEMIQSYDISEHSDPYEQAKTLYYLCLSLGKATQGQLLGKYVDKLENVIESLNLPAGKVRNLIYSRIAPLYTSTGMPERAIEIDKKLLNVLDSVTTSYVNLGRPFRKLAENKLVVNRRILSNYKALTPVEIERFHNNILDLAKSDPEIANEIRTNETAEIFYMLAKKQYPQAIAAIKRHIDKPSHAFYRPYFLEALVEAAGATHDRDTQLYAALELNKVLRDRLSKRSDDRYRELQIIYDFNELRRENSDLLLREQESRLHMNHLILAIAIAAFVLMAILALILLRQYRKIRKLAAEHFKTTVTLRAERNDLRQSQEELIVARDKACQADKMKTEFITNMSHEVKVPLTAIHEYTQLIVDCIPEEKRTYLDRFAVNIEQNTKVLMTLINDVLDMTSLEYGNMPLNKRFTGISKICELAINNIFENGHAASDKVKVRFNPSNKPDVDIMTDDVRVCQVLMNLLSNANKFTDKGTITLDYDYDKDKKQVRFTVTDTGIGIPDDCEEVIFERFRKLNPQTRGCGLGLYIARMVATLLGGTVEVDTDYHGGARFVFTIPA